ncbi:MAG: hypothetical protein ACP5OG_02655 [Candidatus Nanoarchaeia archaeon]
MNSKEITQVRENRNQELNLDSMIEIAIRINNWGFFPVIGAHNSYRGSYNNFTCILAYNTIPKASSSYEKRNKLRLKNNFLKNFAVFGLKEVIEIEIFKDPFLEVSIGKTHTQDWRLMKLFYNITQDDQIEHNKHTRYKYPKQNKIKVKR